MSGRARTTRLGDPSLMMAWTTLKETTEILTVKSRVGKISRLAIEIADAAQLVQELEGARLNPEISDRAGLNLPAIIRNCSKPARLLRVFKPNNRAFNELVYDTCLLVSSLANLTRYKDSELDPKDEPDDPAKLSPTLTAHLQALQMTLQEIKVFAQRRADEAVWKLYLSAKSDSGRIEGFRKGLRQVQLNIGILKAIGQKNSRTEIQDGLRTNFVAVPRQNPGGVLLPPLNAAPHSTPISPILTRSSGPSSPASVSFGGSVGQPSSIAEANMSDSLRVETPDDLRTVLSTTLGVDALLALEKGPVVARTVDLLQLEIRSARLDPGYLKKCATCLEALVNKHHTLPASLIVNDLTKEGTRPCNGGGFSVCPLVGLLKVSSEECTKDIWKGRHGTQAVCLKVLRVHAQGYQGKEDKLVRAYHKETLVWTRLSHPNLLPFIGVNTTLFPEGFCLVSPWMTNGDIIGFLERNPGHDRLASANVLVNEQGHCLLADFGLAITVAKSTTQAKTSTSEMKGSIRWMAPELFHFNNGVPAMEGGKERIDKFARDIYAYACTVLEVSNSFDFSLRVCTHSHGFCGIDHHRQATVR
ncbi:hypothetical protein PM082_003887 [Marasmius tenuissimus]|nr:hypothetical protein PM082_003887 [Marasmius tenuissimus]